MKTVVKWLLILAILGGGIAAAGPAVSQWWISRNAVQFAIGTVERGDITEVVNATGTVTPVLSVRVGSFASGPVKRLYVDYNSRVKKWDPSRPNDPSSLLAEIDPTIYEAMTARDEAALAVARADLRRIQVMLEQAKADERRAKALRAKNPDYLSESEWDKLRFSREALEAQVGLGEAQVRQGEANLKNSKKTLEYTQIRSPVDGIVLDRKIDEGQTLVAQFQVPDLFVVAPDLTKEIHVYASVDEADVGQIKKAQKEKRPVRFTVDAYPDDLFKGAVVDPDKGGIRMNPSNRENVITYTVVVSAANPEMKLLPGMTAKLSFELATVENRLKVPNAALRYYPKLEYVREEDKALLEGAGPEESESQAGDSQADRRDAAMRVKDHLETTRRHVWVREGEKLRAIEVTIGLNDYQFTEILRGDVEEGMELVTGVKKK